MLIPILPATPLLSEKAIQLANLFHLSLVNTQPSDLSLVLHLTLERLELRDMKSKMGPVFVDFVGGKLDHRRRYGGGRKQPLAKAIGLKHGATPIVLDATAGLGRDAFILASLGCYVQMVERSKVVAALLYDGLQRAQQNAEIGPFIQERLQFVHDDAQHHLSHLLDTTQRPDVIYLDPMYPHRQKFALVKKEMQLFQRVVGQDLDASALLEIALACAKRRVVIKRPKWALNLTNINPNFCIKSENTRFDVYQIEGIRK
jgi:16S rRNA (guanine1516-N2)-methyltransferase